MKTVFSGLALLVLGIFRVVVSHDSRVVSSESLSLVQSRLRFPLPTKDKASLRCTPSELSGVSLNMDMMMRATAAPGAAWHWQQLSQKFRDETPLTVLLLGGSVETFPWVKSLKAWIEAQLPGTQFLVGSHGSVGSKWQFEHLSQCGSYNHSITDVRPDLIIMDTSVNPWKEEAQPNISIMLDMSEEAYYVEKIVREVLQYDFHPALLFWEWISAWNNVGSAPFFLSNQDAHTQVLRYYGIPSCSLRDALFLNMEGKSGYLKTTARLNPKLPAEKVLADGLHPGDLGGALIVDVLSRFMCSELQRTLETPSEETKHRPELPAILMTQDSVARLRQVSTQDDKIKLMRGEGLPEGFVGNGDGNATARAGDIISLLSGGAFVGWEVLNHMFQPSLASTVAQQASTPLLGMGLVRLYGILHIVIMHYYMLVPEPFNVILGFPCWARWGKYWVQFFFLLSGFVTYISENSKCAEARPPALFSRQHCHFMWKRVLNLYPTFALSLILVLLCPASLHIAIGNPTQFGATLLVLHSWIRPYSIELNGPSWFLSVLFAFYVVFPHWHLQVQQTRRPCVLLLFLYVVSFLTPCAVLAFGLEQKLERGLMGFIDFNPLCNWHIFVSGMVLGRVFSDIHLHFPSWMLPKIGSSGALMILTLLFAYGDVVFDSPHPVVEVFFNKGPLLLPIFAYLVLGSAAGKDVLFGQAIWNIPFFTDFIPGCAWVLYILHVPLFNLFQDRLDITHPVALSGLAFGVCAVVYLLFDKPSRSVLLKYATPCSHEVTCTQ